jgi:hypothetical protein
MSVGEEKKKNKENRARRGGGLCFLTYRYGQGQGFEWGVTDHEIKGSAL